MTKNGEGVVEEVLIDENEQPYKVPDNWLWCKADAVTQIIRGVSYKKHQVEGQKDINNLLILRGGNIQDGRLCNQQDNVYISSSLVKEEQKLKKGDVVIVSSTGSSKVIGKAAPVSNDFEGESFGAFLTTIRPSHKIDYRYFSLYYQTSAYRSMISKLAKGSNINNIKREHLTNLPFPLPPIAEQKRIANKVERLLDKIEETKQLVELAQKNSEVRRRSILASAFNGELIKFDVSLEELGNLVTLVSGKSLPSEDVTENGDFPYVKISDMNLIENGREITTSKNFVVDNEQIRKSLMPKGTVIFPKRGGAIHTNKKRILSSPSVCDLNIMGIICSSEIDPYYMYYWMQSIDLRKLDNGSSIPQINNKDIKPLKFPFTSIEKQKEIVKFLDHIIMKEDQLLRIIDSNLIQIEILKQSVLSRAFRGKLGTNDPKEENVMGLLLD